MAQLNFISYILRDIKEGQQLFAADILFHLYRSHTDLSVQELISLFSNSNAFLVWETIMSLKDLMYIENAIKESSVTNLVEKFSITEKGKAKVQMIQACFQAGNLDTDYYSSPNSNTI